jgi:hypothetical protein
MIKQMIDYVGIQLGRCLEQRHHKHAGPAN